MDALKKKIRESGKALNKHVLLVDSFLNHQVDCQLMDEIGDEFKRLFENENITKVATIESSGIAPAAMTALKMGVPLVIFKKSASAILSEGIYQTEVFSFTKRTSYQLTVKGEFIKKDDRILLIDDFLANGEAAIGGARLIERAGAKVSGIGIVISKSFQPGKEKVLSAGYNVKCLAEIEDMDEGFIEFADD
ncbi:MAG: xanthine phosphoribosyltransferase [Clostridia bacterium]|nr:xanthine phosphoribosyltransferase [Clostridia bacterium]MBQ4158113.1 xanthine phosphoribosyltransferase [Clostridia bacterium]